MQDSDKKLLLFKDIPYKFEASMFAVLVIQSQAGLRMSQYGGTIQLGPDFRSDSTSPIHATVCPSRLTDILLRTVALAVQSIDDSKNHPPRQRRPQPHRRVRGGG